MHLVEEKNIHASKNLLRLLAIAVDYNILSSQPLSQTLLQLIDECHSGAAGMLTRASDLDMVLETVIAGLPIAAARLSKEQALDYGTILESLRKLMGARETRMKEFSSAALAPIKVGKGYSEKDILQMIWEGFCQESESKGSSGKRGSYGKAYLKVSERFEREITLSTPRVKDFGARTLTFVEY